MPKQAGPVFFEGTMDGLTFYKMNGEYYVRRVGKYLNAKQMRSKPKYHNTMKNADRFGDTASFCQTIYYAHMPRAARKHGAFGRLIGEAYNCYAAGQTKEETTASLIAYCRSFVPVTTTATVPAPVLEEAPITPNKEQAVKENTIAVAVIPSPTKNKKTRYLPQHKAKAA